MISADILTSGGVLTLFAASLSLPLLLIVAALHRWFGTRLAAGTLCLLWSLVAIRLVLPFSVSSPLSLNGPFWSTVEACNQWFAGELTPRDLPAAELAVTGPASGPAVMTDEQVSSPSERWRSSDDKAYSAAAGRTTAVGPQQPRPKWSGLVIAASVLWWLVVVTCSSLALARYACFSRSLRYCPEIDEPAVVDHLIRICDTLHLARRPRVREVSQLDGPAVFGITRPTICLPVGAVDQLSPEQLQLVLSHEVAHIVRRDHWLSVLAKIVRTLHWYNPLAWYVQSRIHDTMEQAADAMALRNASPRRRILYGRLLLEYASTGSRFVGLAFPGAGTHLKRRIQRLDQLRAGRHWLSKYCGVVLILTMAACGLTNPPAASQLPPLASRDEGPRVMTVGLTTTDETQQPRRRVRYDLRAAQKTVERLNPEVDLFHLLSTLSGGEIDGSPSEARPLKESHLVVDGTDAMHRQIESMLQAFAVSGFAEIRYEIRYLTCDMQTVQRVKIPWNAVLPSVGVDRMVTDAVHGGQQSTSDWRVVARQSTVPLLWARVGQDQLGQLVRVNAADRRSSVLLAPKMTLFNGQAGTLVDEAQRPFLTALQPVRGNQRTSLQPIIQVANDGVRVLVQGSITAEGQLSMHSVVTLSTIGEVAAAKLPFDADGESGKLATVQVPDIRVNEIDARGLLHAGDSFILAIPATWREKDDRHEPPGLLVVITPWW